MRNPFARKGKHYRAEENAKRLRDRLEAEYQESEAYDEAFNPVAQVEAPTFDPSHEEDDHEHLFGIDRVTITLENLQVHVRPADVLAKDGTLEGEVVVTYPASSKVVPQNVRDAIVTLINWTDEAVHTFEPLFDEAAELATGQSKAALVDEMYHREGEDAFAFLLDQVLAGRV